MSYMSRTVKRLVVYLNRLLFPRWLLPLLQPYLPRTFLLTDPTSVPSSDVGAGPSSVTATVRTTLSKMSKPTKKATVEELRSDLAALGLETKGKKETLWRSVRLFTLADRWTVKNCKWADNDQTLIHRLHPFFIDRHTSKSVNAGSRT